MTSTTAIASSRRYFGGLFFLLGAYSLIIQLMMTRTCFESFAGNEVTMAVQLGSWLLMTGLGGLIGSGFTLGCLNPLLILLPLMGIWAVIGGKLIPLCLPILHGQEAGLVWLILTLLLSQAPLNLVTGMLFPTVCHVLSTDFRSQSFSAGLLYQRETTGAALGGLGFVVCLEGHAGLRTALVLSGMLTWMIAGCIPKRYRIVLYGLGVLLVVPGLTNFMDTRLEQWIWNKQHPHMCHQAMLQTPYQRIDVGEQEGQHTVFSNGVPVASLEDAEELTRGRLGADLYHTLHPQPESLLVIGDGEPGLVERMLDYPVKKITYLLHDPGMSSIVTPLTSAWTDPRLSLKTTDFRRFLQEPFPSYDLILLDVPSPSSAEGNRFFTVEAFQLYRHHLNSGGVIAFALPSSSQYLAGESEYLLASVYRSMQTVFPMIHMLAGDSMVFIGGSLIPDMKEMADRYAQGVPSSGDEPSERKAALFQALYAPLFEPFRLEQQQTALKEAGGLLNTDDRPVMYVLNVQRWFREMGYSVLESLFSQMERWTNRLRLPWLVVIECMAILLLIIWGMRNKSHHTLLAGAPLAMFASGCAGMLGQLAILFIYQNRFGLLYRDIGLLFAIYMTGLALGSYGAREILRRSAVSFQSDQMRFIGARIASLMVVCAFYGFSLQLPAIAFYGILGLFACALGVEYPLSNRIVEQLAYPRRTVGIVQGVDYLGATLAALFGGTVLLPLLGTTAIIGIIAAIQSGAMALLLIARFRNQ